MVSATGSAPLLVEAGIPIRQLRERSGFRLTDLAGCLVSHGHGDHSRAVKEVLKAGVDCIMSRGTAAELGIDEHHRVYLLGESLMNLVGGWQVKAFPLSHDAKEPTGFLIAHGDDRLLFIPDTCYVRERFAGITQVVIECNNIDEILSRNIQGGHIPSCVGRRVRRNHMNLDTVISMLKANDLSKCTKIYLIHLSETNSDEARMINEIQSATGIPVTAC